jgi:transposase
MENTNWVGVDTHTDTLACYTGNKFKEFKTTPQGFEKALKWAGEANWAIEGAYCFGKPFANYLIKNNCKVYEINPYITKSWRCALSANGNKNDYGDAKVISIFSKNLKLQEISLKTIELKETITARELVIKERTKLINSIKMLCYTRGITLKLNNLTTKKAENYLKSFDDVIISNYGEIIEKLNKTIKVLDEDIYKLLPEKVLELTNICGISKLTAAVLYTETKSKLTTKAAFANYCAVAPIENSSGKSARHSTNHRGNRKLNSALFRISMCQSINDERGKSYYQKKLSEGKTPRQARKCLARQLINSIFKILKIA